MSDEVPVRQDTVVIYEDRPNLATMISGGLFIAVVVYFLVGWILGSFNLELRIIQFLVAGLIIIMSIQMGTSADVTIKIDKQTGFIEAWDKNYSYQGYAHEPELFMVLEKQTQGVGGQQYRDYKLSLKVDEETTFDIPLQTSQVRDAIKAVEEAKEAVPVARK